MRSPTGVVRGTSPRALLHASRGASIVLMVFASCTPANRAATTDTQRSGTPSITLDTIIGRLSEVGAEPATWLSLQPSGGGKALQLSGRVAGLRRVAGAEIWVLGDRQSDGFRVDAFEVRRVNGQPVDDGVIVVEPDRVDIRMRTGARRPVPNAPSTFRGMPGARVWVTRPDVERAPSYGVIEPLL